MQKQRKQFCGVTLLVDSYLVKRVLVSSELMENSCSFHERVGGLCGFSTKDRARSTNHAPLLSCSCNIDNHKAAFSLRGVDNEVDLILARGSLFVRPRNIEQLMVCLRHQELLGISWKRPSAKCSIPGIISMHRGS